MIGCLRTTVGCAFAFAIILCLAAPAFALSEEEDDILQMIYRDKDLVTTATRSAKPISQVAENITVITAEEIEAINAHTLTDVLYHVTGVQMDIRGGPGIVTNALIQGSDPRHVKVVVDGVSLNNLSDNFADIGAMPVHQIERIEIVKGPASSAWGSSLGGIINIITKSADAERKFGGTVSASIGERTTGDFRADAAGTTGRVGYYLYGGGLTSDGLTSHTPFDAGNFYGKLQLQATEKLQLQYTQSYTKGSRGDGAAPEFDVAFRNSFEYLFSTLALNYAVDEHLELNVAGRLLKQHFRKIDTHISTGLEQQTSLDDTTLGGSAKLNWRSGSHNLLLGADYDDGTLASNSIKDGRQEQVKWALFANDTLSLGDFAVTPGVRYDRTGTNGDLVSPSLGITYRLFERTILRAYATGGFNTPPLFYTFGDGFSSQPNSGLKSEKVWSYSLGLETVVAKYFWFKTTCFLHDIRNVITNEQLSASLSTFVNSGKQRRQGVEAELKTIPVYHTSLQAGYTFTDATDRETGRIIPGIPRYTYDLGVDYNDDDSFRGALRGHFVRWNADAENNARDTTIVWDLNLARKIVEKDELTIEALFTAHNIFNGAQYSDSHFPNPGRWFEGGVRCKF
jgi:vitamin B12 transporter